MNDPVFLLVIVAVIAGLYLAFNIGANDVANAMGTAVGSGALNIKNAILLAAIFEFLGALLIGDEVSRTIKQGFVGPDLFAKDPEGFAYGMTAAILATSLWLQYATFKGLPVSTTHSIVGAVLGFAIMHGGLFKIKLGQILAIFFSWLFSPLLGAIISYLLLRFVVIFIIDHKEPLLKAKRYIPFMIAIVVAILSSSFTTRLAYKLLGITSYAIGIAMAILLAIAVGLVFYSWLQRQSSHERDRDQALQQVEHSFAKMQLITACFLAFAHGSNDVANAIGPAAAVISALTTHSVEDQAYIPGWLLFIGGIGIIAGLAVFGRKVMQTVGQKITEITPSRGFSAEFGAALTILMGTIMGLPLSTTHVLVGSVIGVGFARGLGGIDISVIRRIARSWIVTMPITALISMIFCLILRFI